MADSFDPYHVWLGIPPGQRPPTHYQLLSISAEERDRAVINAAVTRQSAYVRNFQVGKHSADAARILNELQTAKLCLLDPAKRAEYDAQLGPREAPSAPAQGAQPAPPPGLLADLDNLSTGAGASASASSQPMRQLPRLKRPKKSTSWHLPVVAGLATVVLVIGLIALSSRRASRDAKDEATAVATSDKEDDAQTQQQTIGATAAATSPQNGDVPKPSTGEPSTDGNADDDETPNQDTAMPNAASLATSATASLPTQAPAAPPVDLLSRIDPARDALAGQWRMENGALLTPSGAGERLRVPYDLPSAYDISLSAERLEGKGTLGLGLIVGGYEVLAAIDSFDGTITGLDKIDGKSCHVNETTYRGGVLHDGPPNEVECRVRPDRIQITVNGENVLDWQGDPQRLSTKFPIPESNGFLLLVWGAKYKITKLSITDASDESDERDPRTQWLNTTYKTTVRYVKSKNVWEEVNDESGRVLSIDQEISRTEDYVELFSPNRNIRIRLTTDQMQVKRDGNWSRVASGHWAAASNGAADPATTKPVVGPDAPGDSSTANGTTFDLLSRLDLARDVVHGDWKFEGNALRLTKTLNARIELPIVPPEDYELTVVMEGQPRAEEAHFSLFAGGRRVYANVDGFGGTTSFLQWDSRDPLEQNPTFRKGRVMRDGAPNKIMCTVRGDDVRVECNDETVLNLQIPAGTLGELAWWALPHPNRFSFWSRSDERITRFEITAISPADWQPKFPPNASAKKSKVRLPKPKGSDVRAAARTVDKTYYKPLRAAKSSADRWAVIDRMRDQGVRTNGKPALQYALLDEARTRAVAMGQAPTACQAIEELGDRFELDVLAAKEEAIIAGLLKATSSRQLASGVMVSLLVIDRAAGEGQADRAERLLAAAETATKKLGVPELAAAVQKRRTTINTLRAAAKQEHDALERLKSGADNAGANREAGLFQSLALGDWKTGLSHLAKASPQFAEIARLEARAEGQPADRPPLAAAWRAVADESPLWKTACLSQARYWCDRASATLVGKSDAAIVSLGDELKSLEVLNRPRLKPGLKTVVYDGADFQNPRAWRIDPTVDFNSGVAPPAPGLPGDYFSIRWTGWLVPPIAGTYVFKTYSDDSIRLRIDGKLLIDHWGGSAGDESVEVKLTDAPHRLIVEFNDYQATASAFLHWSLKDVSTEHVIPADALFHDPALE